MHLRRAAVVVVGLAVSSLVSVAPARAALTSAGCLAQKHKAAGKFQKCRAGEEANLLQGRPGDVAKCTTKFHDKIAKLTATANDAAIECRYSDNGDGTVTDYDTGLQWEKKDGAGGGSNLSDPHDVDNTYTWSDSGAATDGGAYTDFLSRLNTCTSSDGTTVGAGFAGHCDWRLPTIVELREIRLAPYPCGNPCIDPVFGPIGVHYWSSTTNAINTSLAWTVDFDNGDVDYSTELDSYYVRAVRGGW